MHFDSEHRKIGEGQGRGGTLSDAILAAISGELRGLTRVADFALEIQNSTEDAGLVAISFAQTGTYRQAVDQGLQ